MIDFPPNFSKIHVFTIFQIFSKSLWKKFCPRIAFATIEKKPPLKIDCWQVISLTYWWKMSIFKKCIKKTPNIDFVFLSSKTHLHVTNSGFFPSIFFKTCPFLHPPPRNPRFNNSPFPTGTPVFTFLWQQIWVGGKFLACIYRGKTELVIAVLPR